MVTTLSHYVYDVGFPLPQFQVILLLLYRSLANMVLRGNVKGVYARFLAQGHLIH